MVFSCNNSFTRKNHPPPPGFGYVTLIWRNYILGFFMRNAKLRQSKQLKRIFGDPAALGLSAFMGRKQMKTPETHSFGSYSHAQGKKNMAKKKSVLRNTQNSNTESI